MTTTQSLLRMANKALDGRHPTGDFPVPNALQHATAHALVALATQQQDLNDHMASIAENLTRIAKALENPTQPPASKTPTERKRLL